jgi:hypothetical protein
VVADHREHLRWCEVLEPRPPKVFLGTTLRVRFLRKDAPFDGRLQSGGFVLFGRVQVVESPQEQEVRNLLDDFKRIRDAARPERVSDAVDLRAHFTCKHGCC